jgi:trehalose/maltose hydrolase-like predicted phosphorylase
MTLDMRRGLVLSDGRISKSAGLGVRIRALRLVSLSDRAVGLHIMQFEIEDGTGEVTFEASLEGMDATR